VRILAACAAAVATVVPIVAVAAPAHAETWTASDRVGDVRTSTYSDEPRPCGTVTVKRDPDNEQTDIVSLSVDHTTDTVVVTIAVREVSRRQMFAANFNVRTPGPDFTIRVDRQRTGGRTHTFFAKEPKPVEPGECGIVGYTLTGIECDGLSGDADADANTIRVTLPRGCLEDPGWVRVGAALTSWQKGSSHDTWGRSADPPKNNPFVNPLGPRVYTDAP
jgi:hypothetical protein